MIKKGKTVLWAFTLIEIMVVLTIIAIIAIWVSNVNWNRLSDRQKVIVFKNRIISDIETVRNNALFGKGIGTNLDVPEAWRVDISQNGVYFLYQTGGVFTFYDNVDMQNNESITQVRCWENPITQTGSILIQWIQMTLTWATDCEWEKNISFDIAYKSFSGWVWVNALSGLIQDIR